ncbi:MAG: hypothetical protein Q9176_007694 [Flavoplaca citrina]
MLSFAFLFLGSAYAQSIGSNTLPTTASSTTSIPNLGGDIVPTGTEASYQSLNSTRTLYTRSLSGEIENVAATMAVANASLISFPASPSPSSVTLLQGSNRPTPAVNGTSTANFTSSSTSTSEQPTNTQPCNNYPELCNRKYGNITQVAAHNSPFSVPNNAASNQALGLVHQLNDGIRMLQGQTHLVNGTMYYCHTSCDILNAGTAESYFTDVARWVQSHPYDVVTLLIGNGDLVEVGNFTAPLESSGLARYAYIPPEIPMGIDDWPTLSELILRQKRVIIFMDYEADQTAVPYILDEFSQMWETPFSPTNRSFPCTLERPPDLSREDAGQRLYMANHNLNTELTLLGSTLLVATVSLLEETNSVTGFGSLGAMARDCNERWDRPPNFLLVDYYNVGAGSVFEVAAELNNVTYDRSCCGLVRSVASSISRSTIILAGMLGTTLLFISA